MVLGVLDLLYFWRVQTGRSCVSQLSQTVEGMRSSEKKLAEIKTYFDTAHTRIKSEWDDLAL